MNMRTYFRTFSQSFLKRDVQSSLLLVYSKSSNEVTCYKLHSRDCQVGQIVPTIENGKELCNRVCFSFFPFTIIGELSDNIKALSVAI